MQEEIAVNADGLVALLATVEKCKCVTVVVDDTEVGFCLGRA